MLFICLLARDKVCEPGQCNSASEFCRNWNGSPRCFCKSGFIGRPPNCRRQGKLYVTQSPNSTLTKICDRKWGRAKCFIELFCQSVSSTEWWDKRDSLKNSERTTFLIVHHPITSDVSGKYMARVHPIPVCWWIITFLRIATFKRATLSAFLRQVVSLIDLRAMCLPFETGVFLIFFNI